MKCSTLYHFIMFIWINDPSIIPSLYLMFWLKNIRSIKSHFNTYTSLQLEQQIWIMLVQPENDIIAARVVLLVQRSLLNVKFPWYITQHNIFMLTKSITTYTTFQPTMREFAHGIYPPKIHSNLYFYTYIIFHYLVYTQINLSIDSSIFLFIDISISIYIYIYTTYQ